MVQAFLKKWWVESDFKAPNRPLSLRLKVSVCHYNSIYNNTWSKQVKELSKADMTWHDLLSFTVATMTLLIVMEYMCHKWPRYVPLVVNTSQSFPHLWLITGFVIRLKRFVQLAEQELITLRSTWVHLRFVVGFVLLDL